jgi:hypothetical protein
MTTHCPNGLDPARGIRLSHAAYESRRKKLPPEILKCRYEDADGAILQTYDAAAIKQVIDEMQQAREPMTLETELSEPATLTDSLNTIIAECVDDGWQFPLTMTCVSQGGDLFVSRIRDLDAEADILAAPTHTAGAWNWYIVLLDNVGHLRTARAVFAGVKDPVH